MNKKLIYALTIIALCLASSALPAKDSVTGDFVLFTSFTGNNMYDIMLKGSEASLLDACSRAGRVIPVEYNFKKVAIEKSDGKDRESLYKNAAIYLKVDLFAVISAYDENGDYVLKISLVPVTEKYKNLKNDLIVRSRIPENIPLKAARAFASLLQKTDLKSSVIKIYDDGSALIDCGQWHGLDAGSYSTDIGEIEIKTVSRYTSVIRGKKLTPGMSIDFGMFPDIQKYITDMSVQIKENAVRIYGTDEILNKRDGSIKESIQGTCVINQGASFCLPGYGSYMSIEYMGIDKGKTDYAAVFLTGVLTIVHLGLVPYITDFNANYLPWVPDNDRTSSQRRLNYFLWGSLPLTFTASFYSQLAYNYSRKILLPPNFVQHDLSASVLSVFIPGGGMFYKGYRWTGWGLYLGEMSMAGYAVYTDDKDKRMKLISALATVKCTEILISYIIPPSYNYFNREVSSAGDLDFSLNLNPSRERGNELTATVSFRY